MTDDRSTPETVYRTAQMAIERGDWEAFFPCLDPGDLRRLGGMAISSTAAGLHPEIRELAAELGAPEALLSQLGPEAQAIENSAVASARDQPAPGASPEAVERWLAQSLHHRDLVKQLDELAERCLASVDDVPLFVARSERVLRAKLGGGLVSSSLFQGEQLLNVTVNGAKAVGTRHRPRGSDEQLGFALRRGVWHIKLFGKPRARPR